MIPVLHGEHISGVGRLFEQIILPVHLPGFDSLDLSMNGDERVAEAIQFWFRFAFSWLDHHSAWHRPRNSRRMKAIIHQALGDIFDGDALELAEVQNAFVGYEISMTAKEHRIISL